MNDASDVDNTIHELFNKLNKPVYYLSGHGCTTAPYSHEYDRSEWYDEIWANPPGYKAPKKHVYFTVPDNTIIVYITHPGEFCTDSEWHPVVSDEHEKPGYMASFLMRHSASDLPTGGCKPDPYATMLRCGPGSKAVDMGILFKTGETDLSQAGIFRLGKETESIAIRKPTNPLLSELYERPYVLISEIVCRILYENPGGGIFVVAACASYENPKLEKVADEYESHLYRTNLEFANLYPLISTEDRKLYKRLNKLYPLFDSDNAVYLPTMCNTHAQAFARALGEESPEMLGCVPVYIGKDMRGREEFEWADAP